MGSLDDHRFDDQLVDRAVGAQLHAIIEVFAKMLQCARTLQLVERDRPAIGENVLADLGGDGLGILDGAIGKDDPRLEPDPNVRRRREIGDDRLDGLENAVAAIFDDDRRLIFSASASTFCRSL